MISNCLLSELSISRQSKDKAVLDVITDNVLTSKEKEIYTKSVSSELKDAKTYTYLSYYLMNFQDIYLGNKFNFYLFSTIQLVTFFVAICSESFVSSVSFLVFLTVILRNIACVLFATPIIEAENNRSKFNIIREIIDTRKQM